MSDEFDDAKQTLRVKDNGGGAIGIVPLFH
jgi:hypothetical protein